MEHVIQSSPVQCVCVCVGGGGGGRSYVRTLLILYALGFLYTIFNDYVVQHMELDLPCNSCMAMHGRHACLSGPCNYFFIQSTAFYMEQLSFNDI